MHSMYSGGLWLSILAGNSEKLHYENCTLQGTLKSVFYTNILHTLSTQSLLCAY